MRFVEHRLHQVAVNGEKLNAVNAHRFQFADTITGGFSGRRRRRVIINGVDEQARRGDFAFAALLAPDERLFRIAADFAHSGDAVGKP